MNVHPAVNFSQLAGACRPQAPRIATRDALRTHPVEAVLLPGVRIGRLRKGMRPLVTAEHANVETWSAVLAKFRGLFLLETVTYFDQH